MFTNEQRAKAKAILSSRQQGTFAQKVAFYNHQKAIRWIYEYGLPYRINLAYIRDYDKRYVEINPCYPAPGYPKDKLIHLRPDQVNIITVPYNKYCNATITPNDEAPTEEIESICKGLRTWEIYNTSWEYEFAHFLSGYDLAAFTLFDWLGIQESTTDAEERINYWIALQKKYNNNPASYRQEEPLLQNEDLYTRWKFIVDWT